MVIIRFLLLPFAALYHFITAVRNRLYDLQLKPSAKFDVPVIGVGNLAVGGTGKTPMIEHLVRTFQSEYAVATLSRGYGRITKGVRIAGTLDTAATLGDEPFQLYKKFGQKIVVAVGEERALAIPHILDQFPATQVILLDDAFQHRAVIPSMNIMLTDYNNLFYRDFLMPTGRLRESKSGARRADVIVVTKCAHDISEDRMMEIEIAIRKIASCPVFFTKVRYGDPVSIGKQQVLDGNVALVSGIANHKPLEEFVASNYKLMKTLTYGDHHTYTLADVRGLLALATAHPDWCILTTEKDKVKLEAPEFRTLVSHIPLFYLPIETEFIKNGKDFDEMVVNGIRHVHK